MNYRVLCGLLCAALGISLLSCGGKVAAQKNTGTEGGPVQGQIIPDFQVSHFKVDDPQQFPVATAQNYELAPSLDVTGAVMPDVARQVPVVSLVSGKIIEVDARVGDTVKKGQLLFKIRSTDVAGAYSDYRKAVVNELLARQQLDRAKLLYNDGAVPASAVEIAQNAEDSAKVDLDTSIEHLRLFGSDLDHPSGIVAVYAPVSGVISDQEITDAAGVQALSSPNPFTITNMSDVWVVCDVYENDLSQVRLGEFADIRLAAYGDRLLKARIDNIGPILDPNIRTAKVRLQLINPGYIRLGMFATATFHGAKRETVASIPASAVLHLHDRDWAYLPDSNGYFQRVQVVTGPMLPGNAQVITSGIKPGDRVVSDALDLQHIVSQE